MSQEITQLTGRGTVTLPAAIRRRLGLEAGDVLMVQVRDGSVVLTPTSLTPIELYTDARLAEFEEGAAMTDEELAASRAAWGLPSTRE
jgi:antitoxin PrlF